MKKLLFGLTLLATFTLTTSCNGGSIDVCNTKDMKTLGEKVLNKLDENAVVSNIEFEKNSNQELRLTTKFAKLIVQYRNDAKESKVLVYDVIKGKFDIADSKYPIVGTGGRILSVQDFEKMSDNINKAIEEQKKSNIQTIGVGLYKIRPAKSPQYETYTFRLYEEVETEKKDMWIRYNEYSCSMDGDGNIKSLHLGW